MFAKTSVISLSPAAHSEPPLLKGGGLPCRQDGGIYFNSLDGISVGRDDHGTPIL